MIAYALALIAALIPAVILGNDLGDWIGRKIWPSEDGQ